MTEPLVRLRGVSVRYGATVALDAVDLEVGPGVVHAVVGENGAGKSTLLRALMGLAPATASEARLPDGAGLPRSPSEAETRGLAYAPQELVLCPELTVAEHVLLGREGRGALRAVSRGRARERARALLARVGVALDPDARVGSLRAPDRKCVQIARALAADPRVLLLDEPAAALGSQGAAAVTHLCRAHADRGGAVLLVSHHVEGVLAHADEVTVLRDGRLVSTAPARSLSAAELVRRMVGRDLPPRAAREARSGGARAPVLRLAPPIDLPLHAGEVFGLFGLVGAGRSRTVEALARALPGAALVPEERAAKGLVPTFALRENLFLPLRERWLTRARERAAAGEWIARLGIRAAGPDAPITSLSGGNQQKVLLARALARAPRVLLLDEPTQGVDVGAKAEIQGLVRSLARAGTAILLSSSDLPELLALADRIAVMREGALQGVVDGAEATEETLVALACGVAA